MTTYAGEPMGKRLHFCIGSIECKLVQPLWMSVWRFLQKLGNNLPQDPVITFLGIYIQKMSNNATKNVLTYVHSSFACHCQNLETTEMPLD